MVDGFRGVDPDGLDSLAKDLDRLCADLGLRRRAIAQILDGSAHPAASAICAGIHRVESWAQEEIRNLRWRSAVVVEDQRLAPGCGVPDAYIATARDRALVGAFLPSRFDLEAWSQHWTIDRARRAGQAWGDRHLSGSNVLEELLEMSYLPHFEAAAAAFFNALGAAATASIPHRIRFAAIHDGDGLDQVASDMRHYAGAFAAATRSGDLTFTADDLLGRIDSVLLPDSFDAAHLLTEPGVAESWLQDATHRVALAESYVPWVTSPGAVVAVVTGLVNNPGVAAGILADPGAVETLLRRSNLLDKDAAPVVGDLLLAGVADESDGAAAARIVAGAITAVGAHDVHPHPEIMSSVAMVGGIYLDDIAWSLVAWDYDPSYRPRFEVDRPVARRFLLELVRDTEAYAVILAATQRWMASVTTAYGPTTFAEYTRTVSNRADDIGMLLATIIGADRISGIEDAGESARRRAMFLDAIRGIFGAVVGAIGPGSAGVEVSIDFLEERAADLLDSDPVAAATAENDAFREEVLDDLRAALHEVISNLQLTGPESRMDPQTLAEEQGAVLMHILAAVYATMSQFEPQEFD